MRVAMDAEGRQLHQRDVAAVLVYCVAPQPGGRTKDAPLLLPRIRAGLLRDVVSVVNANRDLGELHKLRQRHGRGREGSASKREPGRFAVGKDVIDGLGLTFSFEEYVAPQIASGALVRVLDDWCPLFAGYFLYYPSRRQQPAALTALIETLRV